MRFVVELDRGKYEGLKRRFKSSSIYAKEFQKIIVSRGYLIIFHWEYSKYHSKRWLCFITRVNFYLFPDQLNRIPSINKVCGSILMRHIIWWRILTFIFYYWALLHPFLLSFQTKSYLISWYNKDTINGGHFMAQINRQINLPI